MSTDQIIAYVLVDIAVAVAVAAVLGRISRACRQPIVIGQIVTGLVLGQSVLGRLPGHLTDHLFPQAVLPHLTVLAQVAVVIFMFAVGYEIEFHSMGRHRMAVPAVAIAALVVPMGLGAGATFALAPQLGDLNSHAVSSRSFVLFMAVALSITALPVLAAIMRERDLTLTTAGQVATSAAGFMDVVAWLVLAAVLAGAGKGTGRPWGQTVVLLVLFVAGMLLAVRPLLRWASTRFRSTPTNPVPFAFAFALVSAWVTAALGLHPIFGGFLAGLTARGWHGRPDAEIVHSMDRVGSLLLPLFFVVTGLSLNVGSLGVEAFAVLLVLVILACVGKLGSGFVAARLSGLTTRQSATVAALINTRGLTELIALNVGLQSGIIGDQLFTVLVLMALITTFLTSPLLALIDRRADRAPRSEAIDAAALDGPDEELPVQ